MSHSDESAQTSVPKTRSRLGDFLFAAIFGVISIISALFLDTTPIVTGSFVMAAYLGALFMRFQVLSDARAVRAGTNVTEEQLELLERLRALLNALPQPVMLLNNSGHIEMCNRASEIMFGKETTGRHISSVIRAPQAQEVLRSVEASGDAVEREITFSGSTERTSLFYGARLDSSNMHDSGAMIVMLRDRTEQKKLERMRTDFVANASHELRTPLASMSGFIETLQGHAKNDAAARERFLEVMAAQAERMLRLVEDLIGLSAIELNESKPLTESIDLGLLAQTVVESLQPIAQQKGCDLTLSLPDDSAMVLGDRHELFRLLQNLCENAMKYGARPDGSARVQINVAFGTAPSRSNFNRTGDTASQIAVRAGIAEDNLVHVQIMDEGEGIDPNDLPRLTERFYRVNPQLSRAKGGTGLGLAIVKHILGRHNGGLQIESELDQGSTFTVFFPPSSAGNLPLESVLDIEKRTESA